MSKVEMIKKELAMRLASWHENEMGIRPSKVTAVIDGELVFIRFKEVLCPSELNLIQESGGKDLLREIDERLCEEEFPAISAIIRELTGLELLEIHSEANLHLQEKLFILTLDRPLQ